MSDNFRLFTLVGCELVFVDKFNYLGHIIENNLINDADINGEVKCLYTQTNIFLDDSRDDDVKSTTLLQKMY